MANNINVGTTDYVIEGIGGAWTAIDTKNICDTEFYLMQHSKYGKDAAFNIIDASGNLIIKDNKTGFDEDTISTLKKSRLLRYSTCFSSKDKMEQSSNRCSLLARLNDKKNLLANK